MARDNRITMPTSGAGLTRYFDDEKSKIMISPQAGVAIILIVVILILLFTYV